ncbi:MAG: Hsp70 family protein [Candidatus Competibacteraceae bacterium]|nr:Hsp70 family protein [Candidatus Competibacteraceae bacterium]
MSKVDNETEPRFAVGIDLGTTNSVLSCVDLAASDGEDVLLSVQAIPQLTGPGAVEERKQLPSFIYLPHSEELAAGDLTLPWSDQNHFAVGELARALGSRTPIRLIASAKSWLCHPGIDRRAPNLPIEAPAEIEQLSPLQASILYIEHLRACWDMAHPDQPLAQQAVTLTVPASFDPAARELTAEAARAVGLENLILLEEPQAALYSWIQATQGGWREQVSVGDIILVIDVGGGTTDLSLIAVTEQDGTLQLERIAVGDHILLGGDNMDLALAHSVRQKLAADGKKLDLWQLQALTHSCRSAKETLLSNPDSDSIPVVVPSRGSKLIGGTLQSELSHEEVQRILVEGFFPVVTPDARPQQRARGALTKLGLPYAQDAAITRHLASFLGRQLDAASEFEGFAKPEGSSFIHPTAVLFNGGVFRANQLAERTLSILNDWLQSEDAPPARMLAGAELDLAVARGAAYYGYARHGRGVRIRGGIGKSYFVGVESAMPAVPGLEPPLQAMCIAPFGMEEGTEGELMPEEFGLVVGEPVKFRFFGSSVRRDEPVGTVLEHWSDDELEELEEISAELPAENHAPGEVVPVRLRAAVTEVGTLRLEAVPRTGEEPWKVEFDTRGDA